MPCVKGPPRFDEHVVEVIFEKSQKPSSQRDGTRAIPSQLRLLICLEFFCKGSHEPRPNLVETRFSGWLLIPHLDLLCLLLRHKLIVLVYLIENGLQRHGQQDSPIIVLTLKPDSLIKFNVWIITTSVVLHNDLLNQTVNKPFMLLPSSCDSLQVSPLWTFQDELLEGLIAPHTIGILATLYEMRYVGGHEFVALWAQGESWVQEEQQGDGVSVLLPQTRFRKSPG
mmetsp:Transcript_37663/g.86955  ORF Transcript_37663/g.86955 Transcript_37663/m.86955 type:complete len:226 (-) Transcript_37663:56-733(-)